jgi:low temperature requirement protein LtrA
MDLFFDLIFVAAVAQVGVPLGEDYTALPPCMLLIYLALLCAVQVMLMTTNTVVQQREESEELQLVVELQRQ